MVNMSKIKCCVTAGCWTALLMVAGFAQAGVAVSGSTENNPLDSLSQRLIVLRGEVEDLSAELALQREEGKQRIGALLTQRSEVQARAGRESRNQEKLKKLLSKNRQLAQQAGVDAQALKPVLVQSIASIEQVVRSGLPFQQQERLAALKILRDQMNSGVLSAPRAANRLWAFCEDELHLARENGIYRQAVEIDGESVLVDVARLGMVMLYFRAPDQRYGMARKQGDNWTYEVASNEEDSKRIANLFESLQKQIRTGVFELPSAI